MKNQNENRAVAKTRGKSDGIVAAIERQDFKLELKKLVPNPERFVRCARTQAYSNPALLECEPGSFISCLLQSAQFGLEPDGRHAHLIPFRSKSGKSICTLILDYKGLVQLVLRTGKYRRVFADVVCENDEFEFDLGIVKRHRIDFKKPRGQVFAVYALAEGVDSSVTCCVMTREEIESVRKRSMAGSSGPWVTDWPEMAKKTVFKRLAKWLSLTADVTEAIEADNDAEFGQSVTLDVTPAEVPDVPDTEAAEPQLEAQETKTTTTSENLFE